MKSNSAAIGLWIVTVVYLALLSTASLLPSRGRDSGGWDSGISPTAQNVLHIPAYGLFVILLLSAFERSRRVTAATALALAAACILYGAALEWLQATAIPGRTGSWPDAFWNAIGGAGGCLVWLAFRNVGTTRVDDSQRTQEHAVRGTVSK